MVTSGESVIGWKHREDNGCVLFFHLSCSVYMSTFCVYACIKSFLEKEDQ